MRRRRMLKNFMLITRLIIFSLIIVLIAKPYIEKQTTEQGDAHVTILIDNSSSMSAYDLSFMDNLVKEIDKDVPVTVRTMTSDALTSDLGEDIISYLEQNSNILLISDLQSTEGITIEDAIVRSSLLNSTVSAIKLNGKIKDVGVWIDGESKVTKDENAEFTVHVNKMNIAEYNLEVSIDNNIVYNARDSKEEIKITHSFDIGEHAITAKLYGEDDILENNLFTKTVYVVQQPKVLYVTKTSSKLPELLGKYYQVVKSSIIPSDLKPYYAIVIEDMNANSIGNVEKLADYAADGNGILVIGGMNSYDRGDYKSSAFETILPVKIGKGEKKQGDSNIVILIDMSGSTQNYWTYNEQGQLVEVKDSNPLDVIKALAVDVIETLNRGNRVGVVAFAIPDPAGSEQNSFKAVKISDIDLLGNIKDTAIDKIIRISASGQSLFDVGFAGAYSLIKHETGSRNVILISDGGKNVYSTVKDNALNTVALMAEQGIQTYTVGVGRNIDNSDVDEEYLMKLAASGNGLYFPAGQENRLKILFGTPEEKKQGDEMSLFILNPTHFITKNLQLDAKVYGFNQVVPKSMSRIIVTTDSGEPALIEWRFGLGKVLSLTVFSGSAGLGQMLTGNNSKMLTRSLNYLIGDPERKEEYRVTIPDTYINELAQINVIAKEYPKSDIDLVKVKDNEYTGKTKPSALGINNVLNRQFAVNYPKEFQKIGMNPDTAKIVGLSGGKLFNPEDTKEIIELIESASKRTRIIKTYITWHILMAIIIVYLFEIACRKIIENIRQI